MLFKIMPLALMAGAVLAAAAPAQAVSYAFQTVAPPPGNFAGDFVVSTGLNDEGQMLVGVEQPNVSFDFTLVDDVYNIHTHSYTPLPEVPGSGPHSTEAIGINNSDVIVGVSHPLGGTGGWNAFRYSAGAFTQVDPTGGDDASAQAISNNGNIVGYDVGPAGDFLHIEGFSIIGGVYTALTAQPYPLNSTVVFGVNNSGTIVGAWGLAAANSLSNYFVYSGGVFTPFSVPGFGAGDAEAINDLGVIVGGASNDGYATGPGIVDDHGVFSQINAPGAVETDIYAINNLGELQGSYVDAQGLRHIFVATPVPEPTTWVMLLTGIFGLGLALRRRRVAAAIGQI